MQNAQNAAEIQQRVINLVDFYQSKVVEKRDKAVDDFLSQWSKEKHDMYDDPCIPKSISDKDTSSQLLCHFYSLVAGDNADERIIRSFSDVYYDEKVFSSEEESFLANHFKDMVNYIIQEGSLALPMDVLEFIESHVSIPSGSTIYDPFTGMTLWSHVFKNCSYICEAAYSKSQALEQEKFLNCLNGKTNDSVPENLDKESTLWGWIKIALYANKYDASLIAYNEIPSHYDAIVSYIPYFPRESRETFNGHVFGNGKITGFYDSSIERLNAEEDGFDEIIKKWAEIYDKRSLDYYSEDTTSINKLYSSYKSLPENGKMVLVMPEWCLSIDIPIDSNGHRYYTENPKKYSLGPTGIMWREMINEMIKDHSLKEILQLPHGLCIIIAEKGRKDNYTMFIDARFAHTDIKTVNPKSLSKDDILKLNYVTVDNCEYRVKKGAIPFILDKKTFEAMLANGGKDPKTGYRKMIVVDEHDINPGLLLPQFYVLERPAATELPIALSKLCSLAKTIEADHKNCESLTNYDIPWLKTKDLSCVYYGVRDVDKLEKVNYQSYQSFVDKIKTENISKEQERERTIHMLDIWNSFIVDATTYVIPFIINKDDIKTALVCNAHKLLVQTKTALIPKEGVKPLSLLALLRLPVVYRQIREYQVLGLATHLDDILVPTDLRIINDEIRRMTNEESGVKEMNERFSVMKTEYVNEVRIRKHDMGQKVFDLINTEDLMRYYIENRETESDLWLRIEEQLNHFRSTIHELSEMLDNLSREEMFGTPEFLDLNDYLANLQHSNNVNGFTISYVSVLDNNNNSKPTIYMAKNDLQRVVSNILTNAQQHGFVDSSRKDYEVIIHLDINRGKEMYQIDFRNNGKPLPEGLNKMRYGIKGEKAGQTAGTGLGGSVVKSIVEHYKGDYDVFMDGDWTVIRVYLPIAI